MLTIACGDPLQQLDVTSRPQEDTHAVAAVEAGCLPPRRQLCIPSGYAMLVIARSMRGIARSRVGEQTAECNPPAWPDPGAGRGGIYVQPPDVRGRLTPGQHSEAAGTLQRLAEARVLRVFLALNAHWMAERGRLSHDDRRNPFVPLAQVTAADLLRLLGRRPHHSGGYERADKERIEKDLAALAWARVVCEHTPSGRGRMKIGVDAPLVRLERTRDGTGQPIPYHYRFALGDWCVPSLADTGRQTALLAQAVLAYGDAGVEAVALGLGVYLSLLLRIRVSDSRRARPLRVATLVTATGGVPVHREQRRRLMDYVPRALDRLSADGVIAGWHWVLGGQPATLPRNAAFTTWLGWTVAVELPAPVQEHYRGISERRAATHSRRRHTGGSSAPGQPISARRARAPPPGCVGDPPLGVTPPPASV